ncbi:helix-turn-helix domain-containing protein [Pseudomonas panipatensis]|uniref:helix-turn-helix domain-containing protein n=1 Tax=Pseudomonas panipatensis TaxID=428992 RepID=UPI0035B29D7F
MRSESPSSSFISLTMPPVSVHIPALLFDLLMELGDVLEPTWLSIARRTVFESFCHGVPDIKVVAAATGFSEAKLKDRLAERGLSFRGFIDDLRRALAVGYMGNHGFSLVDVAYLLGFSEQSSFQRAFNRWTGKTPGDYRRSLL